MALRKFCFCVELRTGAIIIAVTGLLTALASLALSDYDLNSSLMLNGLSPNHFHCQNATHNQIK